MTQESERIYKVYKHTLPMSVSGKENDMVYIGITCQEKAHYRWGRNGIKYKNNIYFYRAIQKYGWENFEPVILKDNIETVEDANIWEDYFITLFDSNNPDIGYNLNRGGNNKNTSESTKKLISDKAKER